jgi:hypothetical protein
LDEVAGLGRDELTRYRRSKVDALKAVPAATPCAPVAALGVARASSEPERASAPDDPTRQRRLDWARLMRRSFGLDVLLCPSCGEKMRLIAIIEDEAIAASILGLRPRPPPQRRPVPLPPLHLFA